MTVTGVIAFWALISLVSYFPAISPWDLGDIKKTPFLVSIYGDNKLGGGGALVTDEFVLTTPMIYFYQTRYFVVVGTNKSNDMTNVHHVDRYIIHDDFDSDTRRDNLALLRLAVRVTLGPTIQPAVLPDLIINHTIPYIVGGWGPKQPDSQLRYKTVSIAGIRGKCHDEPKFENKQCCVEQKTQMIRNTIYYGTVVFAAHDMKTVHGVSIYPFDTHTVFTRTQYYKEWILLNIEMHSKPIDPTTTSTIKPPTTNNDSTSSSSRSPDPTEPTTLTTEDYEVITVTGHDRIVNRAQKDSSYKILIYTILLIRLVL